MTLWPTEAAAQATSVLKKVQAVVEGGDATMPNVDKCTVFLTRQADLRR
jgi:2-iminobutanoate/2-iminopropanoate deaminase